MLSFLHLFLMDPVNSNIRHDLAETYKEYCAREPGYAKQLLDAYSFAFAKEQQGGQLTENFIKSIYKISMSHLPDHKGGEYRQKSANFILTPEQQNQKPNLGFTSTDEGIKEFVEFWFKNKSFFVISFESKSNNTNNIASNVLNAHAFLKVQEGDNIQYSFQGKPYNLSFTDAIKKMQELLHSESHICYLNNMPDDFFSQKEILSFISDGMSHIVKSYNEKIATAITAAEKSKIIVQHVQWIDQLHPGEDGNVRACNTLLNKLRRDNGLPLTILLNPNRLDCCSIDQLMDAVKVGNKLFRKFITSTDNESFILNTKEKLFLLQQITFKPFLIPNIDKQTAESFLNAVVRSPEQNFNAEVRLQELPKKFSKILELIEKKEYDLALRNACNNLQQEPKLGELIELLIDYKKIIQLDINKPSGNGKTALDYLNLQNPTAERNRLIALLEQNGAKNSKLETEYSLEFTSNKNPTPSDKF